MNVRRPSLAAAAAAVAIALAAQTTALSAPIPIDRRAAQAGTRISTHAIGHVAAEPTIGVTSEGRVFYTATDFNVANNDVLTSSDGGRKWQVVSPQIAGVRDHLVSKDPYLYVDPETDRVFNIDLTMACSYLSFSDDLGASWTTNPLACGMPVNDHQTLFSAPPVSSPTVGYPSVLYYCYNNVVSTSCSKSLDGGVTFSPTGGAAFEGTRVADGAPELCTGLSGHGVAAPDGTIYLPRGWCGIPMVAISHDEGLTWERVTVSSLPANDPQAALAVDERGNLYYAWVSDDFLPYLAVSRDGGETWGRPVRVSPRPVREVNLLTVDVGKPGQVALAYMGTENVAGPVTHLDHTYATWNGYLAVTRAGLSKTPSFKTGTINPPKDPLFRGSCGPGRCGAVWDFIDVVATDAGSVYASFVDACTKRCATTGPPNNAAEGLLSTWHI